MQVITDAISNKELIVDIISKYGDSSEHNYFCYLYNIEESETPYILVFDDGTAVISKYDFKSNYFRVFREVLGPKEKSSEMTKLFLDHVFSLEKKPKKVWLEFEDYSRKSLINFLKGSNYKINPINYTLIWPVFEMDKWTGDKMDGKDWKNIRYYWNRFFKEHRVEFKTCHEVNKEEMKKLVYLWKEKRTGTDRTYTDYYIHAIDHDFIGYDINRIMIVDGQVAAISAGFKFKHGYYASIGLYNPDIPRCNEIANIDDLLNLKKLGMAMVDFGGVEAGPLEFKKKFMPTRYYNTHVFSIVEK